MATSTAPSRTTSSLLAGLLAAFAVGAFIVGQARVNGELGRRLGDGLVAALISFASGLVLLLVLVAVLPAGRRGVRRAVVAGRTGRLAPWQYLGGLGGALLVASQGLTITLLGTALFTIAVVAGQSGAGLVVDRVGLGPAGPQPTTLPRVAGAVLMLCAVVLSVAPSLRTAAPVALAILPLLAGAALAAQQAVNGQVAAAAGETGGPGDSGGPRGSGGPGGSGGTDHWLASVLAAATTNFVVGTTALAVAAGVGIAIHGWPASAPTQVWLYLGGPFGAMFIGLAAWAVGTVGVLLLALGSVAGQVVMAVALDAVAPAGAGPPSITTVLGAGLTLVAAGVACLPGRWLRRRSSPPEQDGGLP